LAREETPGRKRLTEHELDVLSDACEMYGPIQVVDLIAELRRLRQLVAEAQTNLPDNEQTRDLQARLKAELDRA
jgi:hypothetical protein